MQYENSGRTGGGVSTPQLCWGGNGSPNSKEMLPSVEKHKEMGFSVLFLPGSSHHLDHALKILSWAGLVLTAGSQMRTQLPGHESYILYKQQLISKIQATQDPRGVLECHGLSFEGF